MLCLALAWILDGRDMPGRRFKKWRPYLRAYITVAFLALSVPLLLRAVGARASTETRRGAIASPRQEDVLDYVQGHVSDGQTMLVYPYLPLYYYLTGTFSPSRYDYFQPGMHTAEQAREIIFSLKSQQVSTVLLESTFTDKIPSSWPGTSLTSIANDPVADYILQEYRTCKNLQSPEGWRFLFMVRKDLVCPEP